MTLDRPFDLLSSAWGIIILLLILPIELIADKIARIDHANDLLHTIIRPIAGALMMMAVTSQDDHVNPVIGLILGLAIATAVHWFKMTNRPAITIATSGVGNPIVSMVEDAAVILCVSVSLLFPYGAIAVLPVCGWFVYWTYAKFRSGRVRLGGLLGPSKPA